MRVLEAYDSKVVCFLKSNLSSLTQPTQSRDPPPPPSKKPSNRPGPGGAKPFVSAAPAPLSRALSATEQLQVPMMCGVRAPQRNTFPFISLLSGNRRGSIIARRCVGIPSPSSAPHSSSNIECQGDVATWKTAACNHEAAAAAAAASAAAAAAAANDLQRQLTGMRDLYAAASDICKVEKSNTFCQIRCRSAGKAAVCHKADVSKNVTECL